MNRPIAVTESPQAARPDAAPGRAEGVQPERPEDAVDSNAIRWVLVATVAFWLVVGQVVRMFF